MTTVDHKSSLCFKTTQIAQ